MSDKKISQLNYWPYTSWDPGDMFVIVDNISHETKNTYVSDLTSFITSFDLNNFGNVLDITKGGTSTTSFGDDGVIFYDPGSNSLSSDSTNFNWDPINHYLGILTNGAATGPLQIGTYASWTSLFPDPSSATGVIDYFAGSGYDNNGYTHTIRVYGYYTTALGRIYSPNYSEATVTDDGMGGTPYNIDWSWDQITGVDGYIILKADDVNGFNFDYYVDNAGDSNSNLIEPDGSIWSSGSTVTPSIIGPYFIIDPSTGNIGINQASPEKKFTVNGDGYFKGDVVVQSQLIVSPTATDTSALLYPDAMVNVVANAPYPSQQVTTNFYNTNTGGASHVSHNMYVGSGDGGFHIDHFGANGYNGSGIDPYWTDLANYGAGIITISTAAQRRLTVGAAGGVYIGGKVVSVAAQLEIIAGSTSFAPMLLHSGSLLTTPLSGAIEMLSDKMYFTIPTGTARKEFTLNDAALTSGRVPFATTNGRLTDDSDMTFATDTLTVTGLAVGTAKIKSYNGVATAGFGVPVIYGLGRFTAQTAAKASVATYTPTADGTFEISANVLVTTSTVHSFTVTCAYTDEGNTARTLTLTFSNLGGTLLTTIANAAGAVPYEGVPLHIRVKANTAITLASVGTFTTVTYNIEGIIKQTA